MINEAILVLQEGLASAEDIDTGMKLGCNHPIGPLALADLIGLDTLLAMMQVFSEGFGDPKYRPGTAAEGDGFGRTPGSQDRPRLLQLSMRYQGESTLMIADGRVSAA